MEILKEIGAYAGAIVTIVTLITLIVKPIRVKFTNWITKASNSDEIKEKMNEQNAKIDNLTSLMEKAVEQNEKLETEIAKQSTALQATLRNSILKIYYDYIGKGYITSYGLQNVEALFEQYEILLGNSFVHVCVEKLRQLPIKDD